MFERQLKGAIALEGQTPRQHLKEDDTERVYVRGRPNGSLTRRLFGGHVGGCPQDTSRLRERSLLTRARDSEIDQLCSPVRTEKNVRGLQIPVNDTLRVGVRESRRYVAGDLLGFGVSECTGRGESIRERAARKVLKDEVRSPVRKAIVVDANDVRMGERCGRMRLPLETQLAGVPLVKLESHRSIELPVKGEPYFSHAAATELVPELIAIGNYLRTPQWRQDSASALGPHFPAIGGPKTFAAPGL
jgi:hypothetical protein